MKNSPGAAVVFILSALVLQAGQDRARSAGSVDISPADTASRLAEKAARVVPSGRQVAWQALEFQAFVHFGMNTFTDREWGLGTEDPKLFNPTDFDPAQWIEAVKAAGMRGVIVTAKHHDGLCLWPSKYTEHSVKNSPWKGGHGDVVGEVATACRKAGLKFGIYLSPWDRHEPSYGDSPRYNEHFKNQLRELLTGYGEISEVWFDGACAEGPNGKRQVYDWDGYYGLIRELQPGAVISIIGPDARWIGNEAGVTRESEWSVIPVARMDSLPDEKNPGGIAGLDAQAKELGSLMAIEAVAKKGGRLIWYPGQVDVSIRPGWFYHAAEDMKVKTLGQLLEIYYTSVGGNAQLLLNIPPDKRGRIHENDARRLKEMGDALRTTFAVNLAAGARAAAVPEGYEDEALGPAMTLDGDPATCWRPAEGASGATIVYDLGGPRTFNVVMVQENIRLGQRVESFAVDAWAGKAWQEIARGTTIGWKRLLRFSTLTASKARLRILGSRLEPTVAEFGLYLDPSRSTCRSASASVPGGKPGSATCF